MTIVYPPSVSPLTLPSVTTVIIVDNDGRRNRASPDRIAPSIDIATPRLVHHLEVAPDERIIRPEAIQNERWPSDRRAIVLISEHATREQRDRASDLRQSGQPSWRPPDREGKDRVVHWANPQGQRREGELAGTHRLVRELI